MVGRQDISLRNHDTLVLPLVVIASETNLIPRAEASDKARTAPASPSVH